jgi:hypothetical protein
MAIATAGRAPSMMTAGRHSSSSVAITKPQAASGGSSSAPSRTRAVKVDDARPKKGPAGPWRYRPTTPLERSHCPSDGP